MAFSPGIINHYLRRAKEYGLQDNHPLLERIKRSDKRAEQELINFFEETHKTGRHYDPHRNEDIGVKKYGMDAVKGFKEPEGSFWHGKDAWKEQVPLYTPEQTQYMNSMLEFSKDKLPELYDQLDQRSRGGILTEMFGNDASQGFEKLIGQLGGGLKEYLPGLLSAGAGSALTGGGLGGILQSLIGSAAGQYARNNVGQSPMLNNISQGIGNYYNQGVSALGDLWNNRGQYRR